MRLSPKGGEKEDQQVKRTGCSQKEKEEKIMVRLIGALVLVLLLVSPSLGQQSLVGTYKIVSQVHEMRGTSSETITEARQGYLVLTPTRAIGFHTAEKRQFGTSVAEKAALLDTLVGYAGTYRIEGGKIIIAVDTSFNEIWNGKDQIRNWQLSGNRLTLTSDPMPHARDPSKTIIVRQVWEKIE